MTISVADLIDPFLFIMLVDPALSFEDAQALTAKNRADMLAENPVAATTVFHRRVEYILDNFLFGKTSPFGQVNAFLGRVEQQERHSPHLHLLIWTERKVRRSLGKTILIQEISRHSLHYSVLRFCLVIFL